MSGNHSKTIEEVYRKYRSEFIHFASYYNLGMEDIADAFQDTVVVYYEQLEKGNVDKLNCSEKTYLFSIGKRKLIDRVRSQIREREFQSDIQFVEIEESVLEKIELNDQQLKIKKALAKLGERCRHLLILFYYRRFSIESIRAHMQYKNDNVVKAHKSRCIKELKQLNIRL